MRAPLDLLKESLADSIGANSFPLLLREGVERQAGIQIPRHSRDGRRADGLIFGDESRERLISALSVWLIEHGFQIRSGLLLLPGGNVAEHVVDFVEDTALALACGKPGAIAFTMA